MRALRSVLLLALALACPGFDLQIDGEGLHADRLELLGLSFSDVVAEPQLVDGALAFRNLAAQAYGGQARGHLQIDLGSGDIALQIEVADLDLRRFLGRYAGIRRFGGRVHGRIQLAIPGGRWAEATGSGRLRLDHASVVQVPGLAEIILGVPGGRSGEDVGSAAFVVEQGSFRFLHLAVEDDSYRIEAKGSIGHDGTLDLQVSPYAKLDHLSTVPLLEPARHLLSAFTGRAARFDVTGNIADPRIAAAPF